MRIKLDKWIQMRPISSRQHDALLQYMDYYHIRRAAKMAPNSWEIILVTAEIEFRRYKGLEKAEA